MHEVLVNCLFKLAQEKVWLGELTVPAMTIDVDLSRKATKQTKQTKTITMSSSFKKTVGDNKMHFLIGKFAFNLGKIKGIFRPLVKSAYQKNNFLISQPKHMLWVLKRTVSMRRFF